MLQNTPKLNVMLKISVVLIPWWLVPAVGGEIMSDEESLLDLTTAHLNTGMRGVPVGTCRTSYVTPGEGVHYLKISSIFCSTKNFQTSINLLSFATNFSQEENSQMEWKKFWLHCLVRDAPWTGFRLVFTH